MSDASIAEVEYRLVPGYDGAYRVGDDGSVWSRKCFGRAAKARVLSKRWKQKRPHVCNSYYKGIKKIVGLNVILSDPFEGETERYIHHLVLEAFIGICPDGLECRHLDNDPTNNRLDNLCWGTHKENMQDKIRHGTSRRGVLNHNAKLTPITVKQIRTRAADGETISSLSRYFDVSRPAIMCAINRETWKDVE